ncbi:MAG: cysteine desulfurase family protein [Patescibacteria group bacterium]|jgi:cysteine desulfurase|nr:cysteine desulfurase family protein [Patescibacteria group bacterium]
MPQIYFDHASTTPVDPEVFEAMKPYFLDKFGNASSLHNYGQESLAAVENSKKVIADFLNCKTTEIFFTSGATESDNLVILGLAKKGEHIITSKIEHPAILEPVSQLAKQGVEVTYLDVDSHGLVSLTDIKEAVKENTRLISIMYVNNEIGTIQPIAEIGAWLKELNQTRQNKIYFHTDAVQAVNYCEMDIAKLGVDLLSLSAHKIYGPKGIGVLYCKTGVPLHPIQFGGHQQKGMRPGTINTPGIVGLAKAIELVVQNFTSDNERLKKLRDDLITRVLATIPKSQLNGDLKKRVANNAHFSFYGVEGESMLLLLDQEGVAVSTGSACASGSLEPSYVLMSLGMDVLFAHGSLRITLGKSNTQQDIDYLVAKLPPIVEKLRKISPIK